MTELLSRGALEPETSNRRDSPYLWFLTLWPLAVIFHLAGNDFFLLRIGAPGVNPWVALFQLPMLLLAAAMVVKPNPRFAVALAVSHFGVVAFKLPVVGNHELLLLLLHVTVVLSVMTKGKDWLSAAVPTLRWVLLIAYSAIAFSKLNTSFLDRGVSCAVIFGDEFAEWLHVSISGSPVLSYLAIYSTVIIELSIPAMLMTRRFRRVGVGVGLVFHTVLALEPVGHVFDFTSVLFPLFLIFLGSSDSARISDEVARLRESVGARNFLYLLAIIAAGNYAMSLIRTDVGKNWFFDFPIWLVYAGLVLRTTFNTFSTDMSSQPETTKGPLEDASAPSSLSPKLTFAIGPLMMIVVGLTAVNAISPYIELRTAGAFNMYSNLSTIDGETNHLLVPRTFPVGDGTTLYSFAADAETPNSLDFYDTGSAGQWAIPEENLVNFVRRFPSEADSVVEIARGPGVGEQVTLGQLAEGFRPTGNVIDHFFYLRAVSTEEETSCRRLWGPAH